MRDPTHLRESCRCVHKASVLRYLILIVVALVLAVSFSGCTTHAGERASRDGGSGDKASTAKAGDDVTRRPVSERPQIRLAVEAAFEQTKHTTEYDPSYVEISYPGGDVPIERGVCADVIVRAFRSAGVDLQKEVHEDMLHNFSKYPSLWSARRPDSNIDHRRVPNLMTFFRRTGKSVPITAKQSDYRPGDVVAWELDNHLLHIGLVTDAIASGTEAYLVVHNIGAGARLENVLFAWKIIGHYRMWT